MSQPPSSKLLPWEETPIHFPPELPISQRREEIVAAIRKHQVIILAGETGSGKTTQIPKMCLEAGYGKRRKIACTQPRRVAALSVAKRVAEELKVEFGAEVGAKIRFTDQTSKRTRIKFMTDGMMLSEVQGDPLMGEYDAIIVDEAHERSLNIDFLLGHLNQLRQKRPDLKIIITSATIDTEKFSKAFDDAPIIEVSGRVYPVDLIYAPLEELLEEHEDFTFIEGIAAAAKRIQDELGQGDILAFLPTEKDIREAMELLEARFGRRMEIIPCFGRLSNDDQQRIFKSSPRRKLILATNIAETSLTIPGIQYVIDTGLARISRYNPRGRTKRLPIIKVSQASANQRKGRCGRVADGICIRLYSESDFLSRPEHSTPEIQRANLADVILRMLASKLGDVETFPFIDPPSPAAIKAGYELLYELGAINEVNELTKLGHKLSRLPVDPTVGRMLLEAERRDAVDQILVIASALSIQDPRERPMDKEAAARTAHARFNHKESDFLTLLNIWDELHDQIERLSSGRLRKFCKDNYFNYLRMREWRDIYDQLKRSLEEFEQRSNITHRSFQYTKEEEREQSRNFGGAEYEAIHTCLLTGLLANPGRREEQNVYAFPAGRKPLIFPGSALFIKQPFDKRGKRKTVGTESGAKPRCPAWIMAAEVVETNRLYARTVAAIDPRWLVELGEHILSRSYSDPLFIPEEGRVIARESLRIHGLEIQNTKVSYLKVNAAKAQEIFIREALLNEDFAWPRPFPFVDKNHKLISRIQNAQTIVNVAHWMGVDEAAFQFYNKRLDRVASIHDLNRYLKQRPELSFEMSEADLAASEEAVDTLELFPTSVTLENAALPIDYQYNPGGQKDGVTLKLPYSKASKLNQAMLDWLIPGHLEAKIHHLLKSLPKTIRQQLLPLAERAKEIAQELKPTGETLAQSLAHYLVEKHSIETYASDWKEDAIPEHLKTRIEVVDKSGQSIADSRDLKQLRSKLKEQEAAISRLTRESSDELWREARDRYERPVASCDDLEKALAALPPSKDGSLKIGEQNGIPLKAYPALRVGRDGAVLALFSSPTDAQLAHRTGVSTLIEHEIRRELAWIREDLKEFNKLGPVAVAFTSLDTLKEQAFEHMRRELISHPIDSLDAKAIRQQVEATRARSRGFIFKALDDTRCALEARQALTVTPNLPRDLKAEVDRIVPQNFLLETPHWALPRLALYLKALEARQDTRNKNPSREAQCERELGHFRQRLAQLALAKRSNAAQTEQITELRFAIEEYALSLYAQRLGTAFPISAKRLEERFQALGAKSAPRPDSASPQASPSPAAKPAADKPTKADLESLKKLFG